MIGALAQRRWNLGIHASNGFLCYQVGEVTEKMAFGGKVGYPSFYVLREEAALAYQCCAVCATPLVSADSCVRPALRG
jgi:hypothetical protein